MFSRNKIIISALVFCAFAVSAAAQEFRGSISGRVTEASGGVIASAQVTVTNVATNTTTTTVSNESGEFNVLYLNPGRYSVSVECKGFKKLIRQNIEVRVGDRLNLELPLEVGAVADTVNITADSPILQTTNATAGQVIDNKRISELPLSDGNPFTLTRLASGIGYIGDLKFSRPFDNNGTSDFISTGTSRGAGHEFTLDGVPNTDDNGSMRVAFVPPADAVQEFKIETAAFDAQQGHSGGATVNVTLKSGTNNLHGTLYEFIRNDVLSGNDYFLNRTNLAANPERDADRDGKADRAALRYNRYGGTIGGPIILPKKIFGPLGYDGRNKSFFFFAYEGLKDVFPEPNLFTVPTLAQRAGDFSSSLTDTPVTFKIDKDGNCAGPKDQVVTITNRDGSIARVGQIYDPSTALMVRRCNPLSGNIENRVERLPFAGNIIPTPPGGFSQIAKNYLQYYPLPNQPGNEQGRQNYISANPRTDNFHSESYRFDQTLSDKQKFFFRFTHNNRLESRGSWSGEVNGIIPTGNFLTRKNDGFSYDHIYTFSPTLVLDARIGFSRFTELNQRPHEGQIDPASLGFSEATAAFFGDGQYLPRFEIGGFTAIGDSLGDVRTHNIYVVQPTITKIAGKHSFKMGYDYRSYRDNSNSFGHTAGRYDFGTNFTRGPRENSPGSTLLGQELAIFLLGQPTGGLIDRNASRSNQTLYNGVFFQDDWKVNQKLTLNLGLRYDVEGATTERFNRNTRGFDPNVSSPIEAVAKANYERNYTANPIEELTPANFHVKGGLLFADDQNRDFWKTDKNNLLPRIGFAYQLNEKTVLRGGFGVYMVPFVIDGIQQTGFSQSTSIIATQNNGLTFNCADCGSLFNPFPRGVADPPGSTLGIETFLGRGFTYNNLDRKNGHTQRWEFSIQRELPGQWLFEASYIGNRGYDLTTGININTLPRQYLSTSLVRDNQTINHLGDDFTNPFRNLIPGQLTGSTVDRSRLLLPFPAFGDINTQRYDGSAIYHSGQLRMEKRFTRGYTFMMSYTWSKVIEEVSFLNATDTEYERRIGNDDIPHRIVVSGIWELPFGNGRKLGTNWKGPLNAIIGGWQLSGVYQWQSGRPLPLDNRYFNGDPSKLRADYSGEIVDDVTFDTSGFYFSDALVQTNGVVDPVKQRDDTRIDLGSNIRILPSRFSGFRRQHLDLWDLSLIKNFSITEGIKFQLRAEFLNAFNHPQFNDPSNDPGSVNFGKVTQQNNLPRNIQIGLKLIF